MSEQTKWQEAKAAWWECKRGLISEADFWAIIGDLCE